MPLAPTLALPLAPPLLQHPKCGYAILRALTKPAPKPAPNPVITITQPLPVYPEGESHNFSTNGAATQFFLLSIFSLVVTMVVNYLPDTADEPLLATCDQAEKFVVLVVPTTLRRCVPM